MGSPSRFLEKKFVKDEKGDDITPFDGMQSINCGPIFRVPEHIYPSNICV
jgi:hypothetical protein